MVHIDIMNKSTDKLLTMIYESGKVARYKGIKKIKSWYFVLALAAHILKLEQYRED